MPNSAGGMPDIPSYRFRAYSALFDDRRASMQSNSSSVPRTLSQQSQSSRFSSRKASLSMADSASSMQGAAGPPLGTMPEVSTEALPTTRLVRRPSALVRTSTTPGSLGTGQSPRRASYAMPSSSNNLLYGDGFEKLVGNTGVGLFSGVTRPTGKVRNGRPY